jgi:hypothetical protein
MSYLLETYYRDAVRLGLDKIPKDYALYANKELITTSRSWSQIVNKLAYLQSLRSGLRIDVITEQSQYTLWDQTMRS